MRKFCVFLSILIFSTSSVVKAQSVGINNDGSAPDASAMLDVKNPTKGLLIPRVALSATNSPSPVSSPANSLMIYNTATSGTGATAVTPGFYYWNGSLASWEKVSTSSSVASSAWLLTGNTGTNSANFIGTIDDQPLLFKVGNTVAGQIQYSNYNTSFGRGTLEHTEVDGAFGDKNTAMGNGALYRNSSGYSNTAHGFEALFLNTTGVENTAVGNDALQANITGSENTALGANALFNNTADGNTAVGSRALFNNSTGVRNTGIGNSALNVNSTGYDNIAIGHVALLSNTTGFFNVATGNQALLANTEGAYNAAHGHQALYQNTLGTYNTAMGSAALSSNTEGLHNTALGSFADVTAPNLLNATAIGYNAKVSQSNAMVLGDNVNVGIGTSAPAASSLLELASNSRGLLIPRMSTEDREAISSPAQGLLVYDNSLNSFYYHNGSAWTEVGATTLQSAWQLNGNAGINPASQFIGTTDAQPLLFKVNNLLSGQIQPSGTNTSFGLETLAATSGGRNSAMGYHALTSNTSGNNNTAFGVEALKSNTTGLYNSAFGAAALYANTTGENNTATGGGALNANTTGNENTATGHAALINNTTGSWNTANGSGVLVVNTTGNANTATGYNALWSNTTGSTNAANGYSALYSNTTGSQNIGVGYQAMYSNTSGYSNTATGHQALYSNTTGFLNAASGYRALYSNTTGQYNTANGDGALGNNTSGSYNSANGATALFLNSAGSYNAASGFESLYSNNESYNTAFGSYSLHNTTASQYNTAIGYGAGRTYNNGYNNVFVGANTDVDGNDYYNVIAIGQGTICTAPSQVTMGNGATNSYRAYANWSNISDGRYKKNVKEDVPGLAFINKLRPVTYNLDASGLDIFLHRNQPEEKQTNGVAKEQLNKALKEKEQMRLTGFVAQEVEQTAKQLGFNFSGIDAPKNGNDVYGLRYSEFVVPLVKAVQEQQVLIDKQNDDIKKLKEQVDALTKAMQALSSNK